METYDSSSDMGGGMLAAVGGTVLVIYLAVLLLCIIGMWKIFTKAGKPGWAAIIPIYNLIVLLEITRKPIWWIVLLLLIPIVNFIMCIIVLHALSLSFGKGVGMTLLLIFFPFIALPVLGFGSATYTAPATAA